jgi:hypothetical protein
VFGAVPESQVVVGQVSHSASDGPEQVAHDGSQTYPQAFGDDPDNHSPATHEVHWVFDGPEQVAHDGSQT